MPFRAESAAQRMLSTSSRAFDLDRQSQTRHRPPVCRLFKKDARFVNCNLQLCPQHCASSTVNIPEPIHLLSSNRKVAKPNESLAALKKNFKFRLAFY